MSYPKFDSYPPDEIAEIAEKRFAQIVQKDIPAVEAIPLYYNLVSWMIKELKKIPLTDDVKYAIIENHGGDLGTLPLIV